MSAAVHSAPATKAAGSKQFGLQVSRSDLGHVMFSDVYPNSRDVIVEFGQKVSSICAISVILYWSKWPGGSSR